MAHPAPLAPLPGHPGDDAILDRFLQVCAQRGLTLYPEQEEAILELFAGSPVILATPTGSGKSLVAAALHFHGLCRGRRTVYTCPIKALVNEKFLSLCRDFGPENVGMMTGDATVNPRALVLCCTAEILANQALARGAQADIAAVALDEFHFYSDPERGTAWQLPLLTLPQCQFLLMSATLGDTRQLEAALQKLTGKPARTIRSDRRPVPLEFEYSEVPLVERIETLLRESRSPAYLVYFTQREAAEAAQDFMSLPVCTREEKAVLAEALREERFSSPYGKELQRWLRHGIGLHHAGLLPRYRVLVERLAQRGLLKLICGTDTLGVGVNVPIRTVVLTQLWKYDGQRSAILSVRDFRQITGRAGRRGFDERGFVVVQAPEHAIEARRAAEKAAADPRRARKPEKRRLPEGFVNWDAKTLERLRHAPCEELVSRFDVSHGMILQVLSREGDGCRDLRRLIADCHEGPGRRRQLTTRAWQLFRALLDRRIVEFIPPEPSGRKLRVNIALQDDFSLHQALSLYLIDTVRQLDPLSDSYALDVLSLCESIVEDPEPILRRQVERLKSAALEEMKAAGVPYEERIARLEQIEHPKPLRDFIYGTYNTFAAAHPWVAGNTIRPKSVAREMFEGWRSFADYVRDYGLERIEGLLLRHLTQVYKVLEQTVPESAQNEAVREAADFLRETVRGTDSSLLEEWERLRHPEVQLHAAEVAAARTSAAAPDPLRDRTSFLRQLRQTIYGVLQDAAARDWESAAARLTPSSGPGGAPPSCREFEDAFNHHRQARGRLRLDPAGRAAANTHIEEDPDRGRWTISQVLVDAADANDWECVFHLDLAATRAQGRPVLSWAGLHPVGEATDTPST